MESTFAVVQRSTCPKSMSTLKDEFVSYFTAVEDLDELDVIPLSSITDPLLVYSNYGGADDEFFCVLPKREWGTYFSLKMKAFNEERENLKSD